MDHLASVLQEVHGLATQAPPAAPTRQALTIATVLVKRGHRLVTATEKQAPAKERSSRAQRAVTEKMMIVTGTSMITSPI